MNISDIPLSQSIAINNEKDSVMSKLEITNSSIKKEYDLNSIFDSCFDKCNNYIQKVIDYKTSELRKLKEITEKYREDNHALCNGDLAQENYAKKVHYLTFRDLLQLKAEGLKTGTQNGVFCQNCEATTIKGYRYKCNTCSNFNVCEKCIAYISLLHNKEHSFILKNTEPPKKGTTSNGDPNINALLESCEKTQYEFSYKKTAEQTIKVKVTNKGKANFKINTTLFTTTGNEGLIPVQTLSPGQSAVYDVKIAELDKLEIGHYIKEICIKDDHGVFGNTLQIKVIITE